MTDFHDNTGSPEDRFNVADIQALILHLPNHRPFMLGQSLAMIYEVEPKYVARAVKRNPKRFPSDFYFQLTDEEVEILKNRKHISFLSDMARRANPYGFHLGGVLATVSVLKENDDIFVDLLRQICAVFEKYNESLLVRSLSQKDAKEGSVYLFQRKIDGAVKIGNSTAPKHRIHSLETQMGFRISRLHISPRVTTFKKIERTLHQQFAEKRIVGEWFKVSFDEVLTSLQRYIKHP
jgi:SpoVK/Ycf46/Vps4 family AAA+-type ATPase